MANEAAARQLMELVKVCETHAIESESCSPADRSPKCAMTVAAAVTLTLVLSGTATAGPVHQVFVDGSRSVSEEPLVLALNDVTREIVRKWSGDAMSWEFIVFSQDAYVARSTEVLNLPSLKNVCPGLSSEAAKLLPGLRESVLRNCRARELMRLEIAIAKIKKRILDARARQASCTAVNDLLLRMSKLAAGSVVDATALTGYKPQ